MKKEEIFLFFLYGGLFWFPVYHTLGLRETGDQWSRRLSIQVSIYAAFGRQYTFSFGLEPGPWLSPVSKKLSAASREMFCAWAGITTYWETPTVL